MNITRKWDMPSADTFSVPTIGEFVKSYLRKSKVSVDPFARNKKWATYTNDLNPDTSAEYHMDAVDFLRYLKQEGVKPDLIILDPPYSLHQVVKTYSGYGDKRVNALTPVYDISAELIGIGGVVLNFGFNTNGICRTGFEIEDILIVAHGGHHNDTICMAERKLAHQPAMFEALP
jgi:hypothetical protein